MDALNKNKNKNKALYLQLYESISEDIIQGKLRNGFKLPTRRALAERLGVSENTVVGAYRMLLDTGYITSVPRRGYVVSFKPQKTFTGSTRWEPDSPAQIIFSPNGTDISKINRAAFEKILKNISYNDEMDIFYYVDKGGEFILRNTLSKYLYTFRGVKCPPDRIIVGAGAEYLLTALAAIFPLNTTLITENPCDIHFYWDLLSHQNKMVTLPWNGGRFDFHALYESKGNILFIEPDARFPRSLSMSEEERKLLLDWANQKEDRYIIENCYDSEVMWKSPKTLYEMDQNNKVIYFGSFSRSLSPAVKLSYMALPPELLNIWKVHHRYYYALSSKAEQYVLAEFVNKGYYTSHYKNMRNIYKDKRELLTSCLLDAFGDSIEICGNFGSTYLSVDFKNIFKEIRTNARQNGVKLLTMGSFDALNADDPLKKADATKIIMGFGELTNEQIRLGVSLLKT